MTGSVGVGFLPGGGVGVGLAPGGGDGLAPGGGVGLGGGGFAAPAFGGGGGFAFPVVGGTGGCVASDTSPVSRSRFTISSPTSAAAAAVALPPFLDFSAFSAGALLLPNPNRPPLFFSFS